MSYVRLEQPVHIEYYQHKWSNRIGDECRSR